MNKTTEQDSLEAIRILEDLLSATDDTQLRVDTYQPLTRLKNNLGSQKVLSSWSCQNCAQYNVRAKDGTCLSCWEQNVMGG